MVKFDFSHSKWIDSLVHNIIMKLFIIQKKKTSKGFLFYNSAVIDDVLVEQLKNLA